MYGTGFLVLCVCVCGGGGGAGGGGLGGAHDAPKGGFFFFFD